jgi:hypothetical protein
MAKKRNWTQIGILLLFLVGFPVISYFYLKKGYDYRVDAMRELQEYAPLPMAPPTDVWGDSLQAGRDIVLLHFIDLENADQRDLIGKYMGEIHEQFDGVERVQFWAGFEPADSMQIKAFLDNYTLRDPNQYRVLDRAYFTDDFAFLEDGVTSKPFVMLSDTTGTIRNFYNLENGNELVRLVEHITYLMPPEKRKPATFKPEQEL